MQFEKIRTINKRKIIVGGVITLGIISAISVLPSLAKYKTAQRFNIVNGTLNYKVPDLNLVAMYKENADGSTEQITAVPGSDYILNTTNSQCEVNGVQDSNIGITYDGSKLSFSGLTKTGTKCYVYFDIIKDITVPVIVSVTQTSTDEKTSISVSVVASDDKAVTEYWYAIDGGEAVQGTGSTHTFTGLTAGSSHTISVYVKDAAGNQSTTWSETMKTKVNGISSGDIIAGNPSEAPSNTFATVATTNQGVFKVADPMYGTSTYSYYYRGAVTNNYVKFANFCWRIIRINGDGSVRLIYDGTTCHANGIKTKESLAVSCGMYNLSHKGSEYVGYTYANDKQRPSNNATATASSLKTQTDSWYKTNISDKGYDSKVADGKFCNDRNIESGSIWASISNSTFSYAAYERLGEKKPTLACDDGDVYTLKAGAITADEIVFAGGLHYASNSKYYLYNGYYYWTMSPYRWEGTERRALVFEMYPTGEINSAILDREMAFDCDGIRPVINLKANTVFKIGTEGTLSNPYVVE